MLILLDNNAPRGLVRALVGHNVVEARERGWATLKNGDLLQAAEQSGFELFLTADKNIRYQQNLVGRKIAMVVLSQLRWRLVRLQIPEIAVAVDAARDGTFTEVDIPFE